MSDILDNLDPGTLRRAREACGMSRADLAAAANVHPTTILRIEAGHLDPRLASTWAHIVRVIREHDSEKGIANDRPS